MSLHLTGGTLNRRRLPSSGAGVRPTQNRVREAVFSSLAPRIPGCAFLDLYAGSGAVGLDAWSRGADRVVAVEKDRRTAAQIEASAKALKVPDAEFRVICGGAAQVVRGLVGAPFDVIYIDPPYEVTDQADALEALMTTLATGNLVAEGTAVLVEVGAKSNWEPPAPWSVRQDRRYGAARVIWLNELVQETQ